ncbi:MAG: hypothetical protein LBR11_09200 [Deltaproteobacteria bacterium]|nr:hypothetical protein [Deltaproteobacteria bacterium]
MFDIAQQDLTEAEQRRLLFQAALEWLLKDDMNKNLASLVLEKLPPENIKKELLKLGETIILPSETADLSDAEIDQL